MCFCAIHVMLFFNQLEMTIRSPEGSDLITAWRIPISTKLRMRNLYETDASSLGFNRIAALCETRGNILRILVGRKIQKSTSSSHGHSMTSVPSFSLPSQQTLQTAAGRAVATPSRSIQINVNLSQVNWVR